MIVLAEKIVSLFLMILVGYIATKCKALTRDASNYLTAVLIKIMSPSMLFCAIVTNELSTEALKSSLQTAIGSILFMGGALLLGLFIAKYIVRINDRPRRLTQGFVFASVNDGFMGFPITMAIFGSGILYYMVIHNIFLCMYLFTIGPLFFSIISGEKVNTKNALKAVFNMVTIAAILGFLVLSLKIKIPDMIFSCIDMIGDATVPVSMIIIGIQLATNDIKTVIKQKDVLIMCVIKMISLPVLTFLAVNWLPVATEVKICMVFGATFPIAAASSPVAESCGQDAIPVAEGIALSTLFSIATIPICAMFLMSYYGLT